MQSSTLTQAFENNISTTRFVGFIEGHEQEKLISFEALYNRALGVLYYLQNKGMEKGNHLILYLNSNEQMVDVFWACQFGGIIPVPLAVGISDQHRLKVFNVVKNLDDAFLYTDRKSFKKLESYARVNIDTKIFQNLAAKTLLSDEVLDLSNHGEKADF